MKLFRAVSIAIIFTTLVACATGNGIRNPFGRPSPTADLPTPRAVFTHAPDPNSALNNFFAALKLSDYVSMYAILSDASRAAITQEDFSKLYNDTLNKMTATSFDFSAGEPSKSPSAAQVAFNITYHTALAGDLSRDMSVNLVFESGTWRIQWTPTLILPELADGNVLARDCSAPARGDIFDRTGQPLVSTTEVVAIGVNTADVNFNNLTGLTDALWRLTGVNPEILADQIVSAGPGWYIAVGTASNEEARELISRGFSGLVFTDYTSRYYAAGGLAAQLTGYTLFISPENIDSYKRRGYCGDERVGNDGIESSLESTLAGEHGGSLYIASPSGQIITRIGQVEAKPASSVYLTINKKLQANAERAIAGFTGAVVVIERDTGRILAMASSPTYDPNLFDPQNPNNSLIADLFNDQSRPLVNRAAQGQYPLGSVFKVITMAAGMESGLYLPESTYECQYDFTEISGQVLHDWTWDHCQERLRTGRECNSSDSTPSGLLTLQEGLMRSCNPYFYHIGLDLFRNERGSDIANMARAFGLGAPTGIDLIEEEAGQILDPNEELAATNQAIGQGDVLVTPLQVARFMAAIGNGGTLYRPQILEKIVNADGTITDAFAPEAVSMLPIQPDRLVALQQAMGWVITSSRGTANFRIGNLSWAAAGKTGSAQNDVGATSHAWFAGYTYANIPGVPDIAVAVILENAGEGSDYAAPVFRRMLESYFLGSPQTLFWFESNFGITKTPTPFGGIPTNTPKP